MEYNKYILPIAVGISMLAAYCGNQENAGKPGAAGKTDAKDYPVLTIDYRDATLNSEYPATIEGQQNVEIRPKIDGYIEKIYVDEGSTVKKGQLLFHISAPQYEQEVRTAQANIKIAEADVNAAKMEVEKVRPLVEKKIISEYELQTAQFNLESREAALAQAMARLANARTNVGYTVITSPVNGVVGTLPYKIGSLVSSNTAQPLTTVSNIGNIYAYFSINEKEALELSRESLGKNMQERLDAIPPVSLILSNGTEFPQKGKVETASGLVNTETGSIRVRATFPNPGNLIRSGSSGIVRIPSKLDSAILVPQKSTYELQGKKFVYILEPNGTVRSQEIRVIPGNNGQVFVVTQGLKKGDRIVVEGVASLREGLEVNPRPANADSLFTSAK